MALELKKAKRTLARMKIGISGASGSGKTMSALLMAYGLVKAEHPTWTDDECWDKVCIIDTENMSGSLYVNTQVGSFRTGVYNTIDVTPPFEATKFIDAIHIAENADMEVIIIDSLSHAWSGEGGALDKQGKIAARIGNSYTAWRDVTPEHNKLVDAMLQSKCHVIADMRAKMDYQQEKNEKGKSVVKSLGLAPIARDGMIFEFTTVFMLDADHIANATKDRTGLFDNQYFVITPETGKMMYQWLSQGAPEKPSPVVEMKKAEPVASTPSNEQKPFISPDVLSDFTPQDEQDKIDNAKQMLNTLVTGYLKNNPNDRDLVVQKIAEITGGNANYYECNDIDTLRRIYATINSMNK